MVPPVMLLCYPTATREENKRKEKKKEQRRLLAWSVNKNFTWILGFLLIHTVNTLQHLRPNASLATINQNQSIQFDVGTKLIFFIELRKDLCCVEG